MRHGAAPESISADTRRVVIPVKAAHWSQVETLAETKAALLSWGPGVGAGAGLLGEISLSLVS